ncbi:MAG: NAD(P)/FAD-dependent oxidoreductase [Acidobacteria bacterium]|nr:NAD(P)/FAD-dependent oxidoreductase [Acidobacteriota bacterium]MCA1627710.1 NAD(P)/FAD-dependent oxidoreductase [Acidobacteriota bacterium]
MAQFDVLIVGAGPAGSFAAELLARSGAKVALFDGRPAGEPKACGGGVTAKALKAWPELLNAVGRTIHELDLYSPSGKRLHLKLDEPFAVYSRVVFDGYLRDRARDAGAQVLSEKISSRKITKIDNGWRISNETGEWSGAVLVGADGANSGIAKMLAGPLAPSDMEVAFGYRAPLPAKGIAPTVVAFLPRWVGYAWAFPRPDHLSFGIATTQDAFEHQPLDDLLWRFMIGYYHQCAGAPRANATFWKDEDTPATSAIREQLRDTADRYAARIPGLAATTWDHRTVSGDNWALLGDAAGFADPVTGEGIYYALRSAELYTEAYLRKDPASFETSWRRDFGAELRRAAQMRRRFYGNFWGAPFTERMIEFAKGHRGVKRVLGSLVAGEQGYTDLKKKLVKSALRPILFIVVALLLAAQSQALAQKVKQPPEVLAAYRVVHRFQELLAADLEFDRAYEATFPKDPARRRAIAIAEGEFGDVDFTKVDDATLITAYKNQMQLLFYTLLLIDPDKSEASLPERIKEIHSRGLPNTPEDFRLFAETLKEDVVELRMYLNREPAAARRLRLFKLVLAKPVIPPANYVVKPLTSYSKGKVLGQNERYYEIERAYSVIREGSEMKIIGLRFFTLF